MSRSFLLLLLLSAVAVGAGFYLEQKFKANTRPRTAAAPATASTQADLVPLTGMGTVAPDGSPLEDKQIQILQSQIEYLEEQNKLLQQENSQLIDQLGALRGGKAPSQTSPAPTTGCAPAPQPMAVTDDAGPDFAGIGIELLRLRGLKDIPIPTNSVPPAKVEEKITKWLATQFPADQGRKQGRALAALGAIPRPVDTIAMKASFMTYQIGGWFDESEQTLFLAEGVDGVAPKKENAMALSYGYLFKHYSSSLFSQQNTNAVTLDGRLAKDALISGDASHLRFLHALQNPTSGGGGGVGEDPDDPSRMVPIPNFLREMELLPFSMGLDFMQAMYSIGEWDQVNATYSRPPISSAEVLDTQVYLQDTPFMLLPLEWSDISMEGNQPFWDDRLGPLGVVLFLKQHVPEPIAAETAPGWMNDRLLTYENQSRGRDHVIWQTLWKDNEAADGFFSAARLSFLGRNKGAEAAKDAPAGVFKLEASGRVMYLKRTHAGRGVIYIDVASAEFADEAMKKFGEG